MRINEYNSFEEFYEEYNYDRDVMQGHLTGIQFKYNNKYYRLSKDYYESAHEPLKYWCYIITNYERSDPEEDFELVGKYHTLDEALDNWNIDGKKLRDVIMDDQTQILDKD